MNTCSICGKEIDEADNFCARCAGKRQGDSAAGQAQAIAEAAPRPAGIGVTSAANKAVTTSLSGEWGRPLHLDLDALRVALIEESKIVPAPDGVRAAAEAVCDEARCDWTPAQIMRIEVAIDALRLALDKEQP